MIREDLNIDGARKITFPIHKDGRGLFREWFKSSLFLEGDADFKVQQANMSESKKHVIRGIHFSIAPEGQSKIVTVISGNVTDILVDLRIGSPTYLNVAEIELSDDDGNVVFIPNGVGHGFIVRSELAKVTYLTSSEYAPSYEKSINPTDPELGINWRLPESTKPVISDSDKTAPTLSKLREDNQLPLFG